MDTTAVYLEVSAEVRYWDDATINGVEDTQGTLIPFREGDLWRPVIDLDAGRVLDWPDGVVADIHYKVCDAGEYWLLNAQRERIAKWGGSYVPDAFLCHGDTGYGDYIILVIDAQGIIQNYQRPKVQMTHSPDDQTRCLVLA